MCSMWYWDEDSDAQAVVLDSAGVRGPGPTGRAGCRYGATTGWITTGPGTGLSSVAWETPGGVITSIALGTVDGLTGQIGAVPPTAHTPNE